MDETMLERALHLDKYLLAEQEVCYRSARKHFTSERVFFLDSPDEVRVFMAELFESLPVEVLYAIALDSSNGLLGFLKISQGTVNRAVVYPRALLTFLLVETNATAVILAHNHPGGRAEASSEDIAITRRLWHLLKDLDVRLLDHLIYAPGTQGRESRWVSFSQRGILAVEEEAWQ